MKIKCSNCHKSFDYEKYYGLCPKCGTYNAKPREEVHEELHRFYGEEEIASHVEKEKREQSPVESERRKPPVFIIVMACMIAFAAITSLAGIISLKVSKSRIPDTSEVEIRQASVGQSISYGEYTYEVLDAVNVADADEYDDLPKDTKLIAVYLKIKYDGNDDSYKNRFLPYIYDGKDYIMEADSYELEEYAYDCGLSGKKLSAYSVYALSTEESEGYLLYLVRKDCTEVTVSLECRENTYLKRIYEVPVTLQTLESSGWYDFEDGIEYDYGDMYDYFYEDGYDYEEDDYGMQNMSLSDCPEGFGL